MARHLTYVIVVCGLVLSFVLPDRAMAQSCIAPVPSYALTTPNGFYPGSTVVCSSDAFGAFTLQDADFPCGEYVTVTPNPLLGNLVWIYPPDYPEDIHVGVSFYLTMTSYDPEVTDDTPIYLGQVYDNGNYFQLTMVDLENRPYATIYDVFNLLPVRIYSVDLSNVTVPGGDPDPLGFVLGFTDADELFSYGIASFRFGVSLPEGCTIPGTDTTPTPPVFPSPTLPATFTPNASGTPGPTFTPRPSTPTPGPTGTGFLPTNTPYVTRTPISFPVIDSEPTATPWPLPTVADLIFPTLDFPDVVPINTPPQPTPLVITNTTVITAQSTTVWEMFDEANAIATAWSEPIEFAGQVLVNDGGGEIQIQASGEITDTASNFDTMLGAVTYPVRFIKAIKVYLPNTWVLVYVLLACFIVIFSTLVLKFAMAILGDVVGVIRDIWEAIPLN